jgi:diaminohydroxyphosphoribosylaminopyrimidine deaminase/5-amino-6-(5-phosphoribosylamino)uracil reductase
MATAAEQKYMARALELAEKGRGKTSPNPMVGAVLVKNGHVIAEGYHRRPGADHAEIVALKKAGPKAAGATLYVTLEPCCHRGRTGPCTDAIIEAGIARVVYAAKDPNPMVNGKGATRLRKAGVKVDRGLLHDQARQLNEMYLSYHEKGRPFVILKSAQTIDGRIATSTGDSQWISGSEALKYGHRIRAAVDAVVVGMGTVRTDDPSLTVRHVRGRNPYRVVVSSSLRFPKRCHLLDNNADGKTIVATSAESAERFSRRRHKGDLIYWELKTSRNGLIDLNDFMKKSDEFGFRSLLVEGGRSLATAFLRHNLVDKYITIISPKVIGDGINAVGDLKIRRLSQAMELERSSCERVGRDIVVTGYPAKKGK